MFTNVLIGIDGRRGGHDAIALSRRLAPPDADVTLAHVCPPFLGRGAAEANAFERAQAQDLLEHERELASEYASVAVAGPRPVGRGLHELAEERGVDLIVVGATRHNRLGRVLIGDDSAAVLDGAPCAVAIAPPGYSIGLHHLRHLGVGYDASAGSEAALNAARELASADSGEITLLWVISPLDVREAKPIPADWPSATDELMDSHLARLGQIEGVTGLVACGGPREALGRFSRELDLLIVGSRCEGPAEGLVPGPVCGYLAHHAACPLLVVPAAHAAVASQAADAVATAV